MSDLDFATHKLPVLSRVLQASSARLTFTMSIKETVLRYEGPPRTNTECFKQQKRRIADDEAMAFKMSQADEDWDTSEIAKWSEKLEQKVGYKRTLQALEQQGAEVKQAATASIMVRKRALEVLLQKETDLYDSELASLGKTFHTQRV
eukprot:TRINITY_DN50814_c1_g2_i1.p1 TRINITY_DN50814_c1_g2~~TRINITY_DN50814_c1_g2_i1.p1  ORF type:complete len:148 (+),score=40.49 TRINITY_DN50814_c1_g2_i1:21-464(+)